MHILLFVQILDSSADLHKHSQGLLVGEGLIVFLQCLVHVFIEGIYVLLVLEVGVELDDVGVAQLVEDTQLVQEQLEVFSTIFLHFFEAVNVACSFAFDFVDPHLCILLFNWLTGLLEDLEVERGEILVGRVRHFIIFHRK